ncbi:threonine ammonia-lyase IlvA [Gynuella sp.]|uniref:threonine ammonia-lyase IlvA n=1 Tax=Gynuella sp. TaxID=2969146 RepID=UPI003D1026E4
MSITTSEPLSESETLLPTLTDVLQATDRIHHVVKHTPLQRSEYLSQKYQANILLKREDQQLIRSFKLRGALNKMIQLSSEQRANGVVCASAGNHSQGVAYSCSHLKIPATIYMPRNTPAQKVSQVRKHGGDWVRVVLVGENFDESYQQAIRFQQQNHATFIHPFDDFDVISGQGTMALEILEDSQSSIDYLFSPIGGGGLVSGLLTVFKASSPHTRVVGVEPENAAAMSASLKTGRNIQLNDIDPFVDGAATLKAGELGFKICQQNIDHIMTVHESEACKALIELYQEQAIVAELAGSLSIAALEKLKDEIRGKTVVCILSGSNNDFYRFVEIKERAHRLE